MDMIKVRFPGLQSLTCFFLVLFLCGSDFVMAADNSWTVTAEEWSRPRSGASLVQMPPLRSLMSAMQQADHPTRIVVRYPGGEEGALWANELRDWFVALGVPIKKLVLQPGNASDHHIVLVLEKSEGE